LLTEQETNKIK